MTDRVDLKGVCQMCGGHLAFPAEAAGRKVECPHCGGATLLESFDAPTTQGQATMAGGGQARTTIPASLKARKVMPRKIVLTLILLITAVISGALLFFNRKQRTPSPVQVLDYHLSKQPESSLVYVLGTLTNHSDQALLGVTVEFNLLNGNGEPIGKAQDYLAILEPRKAWRFKALVLDPTAVSAEFNLVRVLPP